jgi:hypothetical protein
VEVGKNFKVSDHGLFGCSAPNCLEILAMTITKI